MVLWEITVVTAYFLGLKRTYRLALRIQKRLIGPKHPKIRQFVHRRVRGAFDVAVSVHQKIQQRDIEVGRNLGNWILRWLDQIKPSAEIRVHHEKPSPKPNSNNIAKGLPNSGQKLQRPDVKNINDRDSKGKLLFSPLNMKPKSFPTVSTMTGMNSQYRHFSLLSTAAPAFDCKSGRWESGVFRKDIALLMRQ